jgi:hypothetical protein
LVGVGGLAVGSLGANATSTCARQLPCVGVRLPAPITITTGGVSFLVGRDGHVRHVPGSRSPYPRGAAWFPATSVWFRIQHGHLVVGRAGRTLWRSYGEIASASQVGVIAASSHFVAFQHDHQLYLAPLKGAERPVARRELPLGWTREGLYTYRYQGQQLLLRSSTGTLVKVIARGPLVSDYDVANGSLVFISHGFVMSARGARVQRLASLSGLGLSADPFLQPIGRLLALEDGHRLVVLHTDGTVFAWTPLPRSDGQSETISSSLVTAPRASAIAFAAASGQTADPNAARRSSGTETVYLLRPGAHTAMPVHRERVTFAPCERGASLEWRGRWLLYSDTEGKLAVIDATGGHRAIELDRFGTRLLGTRDGFSADWSGQPTTL